MISAIKQWSGKVIINDTEYKNGQDAQKARNSVSDVVTITLLSDSRKLVKTQSETFEHDADTEYIITVKQYMTKEASPEFDFMQKWNNNNPMPLRTMVGTIEKETNGMYYMKLHGAIISRQVTTCMKCGRPLTNKVSQFFGIGPECGSHNYVNPFDTQEELDNAVSQYNETLHNIKWEGWVIKSAITSKTAFKNDY